MLADSAYGAAYTFVKLRIGPGRMLAIAMIRRNRVLLKPQSEGPLPRMFILALSGREGSGPVEKAMIAGFRD